MKTIVNIILRCLQLAFAVIVAGITGNYLMRASGVSSWHLGRFIYTEVIAALSIIFALLWMIPFPGARFVKWPVDVALAICWFISFGLLVNRISRNCGYVLNWYYAPFRNTCSRFRANTSFAFLSAIAWLATAALAVFWVHRSRRENHNHRGPVAGTTAAVAGGPDTRVESQPVQPLQPQPLQPQPLQPQPLQPQPLQPQGMGQPQAMSQPQPVVQTQQIGQPEMRAVQ
ncbi:hypothetical protein TD95_000701 [Thielaviopsis punctulata]|uniref:MARVEL domain-containing protein n=1 Tax=Thielaviopsis punctulata TaxID=72032 RepID=A0A0F4ZIE2_9PEZI|nr:hypothetical protein TD95_000701 [Thielaviopsis punctulata]